uniref:Sushi, von Willebrand factor type A, EGF and pentraxin domain-containing protein 1 n=1 Tax=Heterorhabditis bacteriophora TaxID=37862 RepID=A0A1I7X7W2_HETBA
MALSTCARYGAQLARLESARENDFVASLLSRPGRGSLQEYWIGLISQQQIDDVVFVWSDGSPTSRYVGFWEAAQPDYTKGGCTMLTFDYFETEEFVDIVTVLDGGPAENSSTVLATLSGSKPSQFSLFSSSNTLIIRFRSDPVIQARGFQAQWRADYPHEAECVWTIQAAKGQLITLSIEDLSLSPDDSLVIYDGESPSSPILANPFSAATCPALPPFANGDRHLQYGDGTGYGTVFAFVCRPGYSREGAATLLCKADGQWSFEQPHCNKLTCSYIPRITNGRLSRPEPFQFGDSARLQCDPGFRVDGPEEVKFSISNAANHVKCLANQSLSVVPSCRDIDECSEGLAQCVNSSTLCVNLPGGYTCQLCPKPSSLPSSSVFASSEAVPVSLLYSSGWCATKTDPQRAVTLHYSVPKVIEKIRFEKVTSGETTSIKIMYSEEEGLPLKEFVVNGQDVFPLSTVGSVGGDVFILPYSIECRVLQISIITSKGEPCMKVCACREGYDLFLENGQGGVNLEEGETGEDPHDIIRFNKTCVPRVCPPVQPLENGKLLSTLKTFHYPIVVRFQCDFGYQMMGPDFIQCLSDGSWNGTTPFCLPLVLMTTILQSQKNSNITIEFDRNLNITGPVCVDPGFPDDGSIELNSVEEGAIATFTCNRPAFSVLRR